VHVVFETHSLTEDNERGRATGWLEGRLSEHGRQLAEELGERRRSDALAAVFVSDLARAVETAEIAFSGTTTPLLKDWRLRECNYGDLNGMPTEQLVEERPLRLDTPYPGGESWREAVERHRWFFSDLLHRHDGDSVLVIGHVSTWWAFDHLVGGEPLGQLVASPHDWQEGWQYTLHEHFAKPAPASGSETP